MKAVLAQAVSKALTKFAHAFKAEKAASVFYYHTPERPEELK